MAVSVARCKIHSSIHPSRIITQSSLHQTLLSDERGPVVDGEESQTGNAVSNTDLIDGLRQAFFRDQLFGGQPKIRQPMLEPAVGEGKSRIVALEVPRQLGQECTRQPRILSREIGEHKHQIRGAVFDNLYHPRGPVLSNVSVATSLGNPR